MSPVGNRRIQEFQSFGRQHRRLESAQAEADWPILPEREPGILPDGQAIVLCIGEPLGEAPEGGVTGIGEKADGEAHNENQHRSYN